MQKLNTRMLLPILMLGLLFWQCDKINQNTNPNVTEQTCEGCHTNLAALTTLATTTGSGDASGALAPLSPAQRVHIELGADQHGFSDIDSTHARMSCAGCHSGQSPVAEATDANAMSAAHQGLVRDPSVDPQLGCGGGLCHGDIARRHLTSIHRQGWGEKAQLALRYGGAGYSYSNAPVELSSGFEANRLLQSATCGQCHISRPIVTGGGFAGSATGGNHQFIRKPNIDFTCTACHSNTVGIEWRGELASETPDLHESFGFTCQTCHTEDFHGAGSSDADLTSVYDVEGIASCYTPCHVNDATKNIFHEKHWAGQGSESGLSCYVCHGQAIKHFESGYVSDYTQTYEAFKIGFNPNYQQADQHHSNEKWSVVRHTPVTRDAYSEWGISALPYFDEVPTYQRTSPHNLQRWTSRTLVESSWIDSSTAYDDNTCWKNCHLHNLVNGSSAGPYNYDHFLREVDLDAHDQQDEKLANASVTVDGGGNLCNACHAF